MRPDYNTIRAVIRLHSSAAYPTTRSPIFTPSYSASQRCLLAIDNVLYVSRLVVNNKLLDKLGPPFAFTLWVSARLLLVHGSTIARTVSPDFAFFVDTLAEMGTHWKVAERYSSILYRVLDEYGEYQQAGSIATEGAEQRSTPSTVKILADMRRCAFDLDFLISRQPRSSPVGSTGSGSYQPPTMPTLRNPAPNELEYLDVFGFFNVPRVPPARALDLTEGLDVSEDPTSNNQDNTNNNDHDSNPMSIHGLTSSAEPTATATVGPTESTVDGPSSTANEFNITNYLIPTPETDWLFRSQG